MNLLRNNRFEENSQQNISSVHVFICTVNCSASTTPGDLKVLKCKTLRLARPFHCVLRPLFKMKYCSSWSRISTNVFVDSV